MTRRLFLGGLLVVPQTTAHTWTANDFSHAYNEWVERERNAQAGGIDAKAVALWQKVKTEWPKLKEKIDAYYQGN